MRAGFARGAAPAAARNRPGAPRTWRCHATIGTPVGTSWSDEDYVQVGVLGRAHGVHGEISVFSETSFPELRFNKPGRRFIQAPTDGGLVSKAAEPPAVVELIGGRQHVAKGRPVWLLRLEGCTDRDVAESLRNFRLLVHKSDREPSADEDEFYAPDLLGVEVVLNDESHERDGMVLGCVADVYDGTGSHDLLRIAFQDGIVLAPTGDIVGFHELRTESSGEDSDAAAENESNEWKIADGRHGLLPFVKDFVPIIDLRDNCIEICPPAGWLEMYLSPKRVKRRRGPPRRQRKQAASTERPAPELQADNPGVAVATATKNA